MRFFAMTALFLMLAAGGAVASALPVERIVVDTQGGRRPLTVQIAADGPSQSRGLMGRKHLAPNSGMLFDFHMPLMAAFWMKDTPISLDMIFVRADGKVSSIASNAVPYSTKEIVCIEPIRAVVEINGGRARALGIKPGDVVHASIFNNAIVR